MFRPIRRKKKEIDINAAKELLQCSRRGVPCPFRAKQKSLNVMILKAFRLLMSRG